MVRNGCASTSTAFCTRKFSEVPSEELAEVASHVDSSGMWNPELYPCFAASTLISQFDAWTAYFERHDEPGRLDGSAWITCEALANYGRIFARWRGDRFELCVGGLETRPEGDGSKMLYELAEVDSMVEHVADRIGAKMFELVEVKPVLYNHLRARGWLDARLVPGTHYHRSTDSDWRSLVRLIPASLHVAASAIALGDPWAQIRAEVPSMKHEYTPSQWINMLDRAAEDYEPRATSPR
jgi:hypothetical protein